MVWLDTPLVKGLIIVGWTTGLVVSSVPAVMLAALVFVIPSESPGDTSIWTCCAFAGALLILATAGHSLELLVRHQFRLDEPSYDCAHGMSKLLVLTMALIASEFMSLLVFALATVVLLLGLILATGPVVESHPELIPPLLDFYRKMVSLGLAGPIGATALWYALTRLLSQGVRRRFLTGGAPVGR